jgi:ABC-type sugar transport system substrate-binding protein
MKTTLKLQLVLAVAALALASLTGCVAVVAGAASAGTVAWVRGELESTLSAGYDKSAEATNLAVQQLQLAKISETKSGEDDVIIVRTAGDRKVRIRLTRVADSNTKVRIRVGWFGDEALSLTVLEKIRANL